MIKQKSDKKSRIVRFLTLGCNENNHERKPRRSDDWFWKSKSDGKIIQIEALYCK